MYLSFDDPKKFLQNFSHSVSKESAENLFSFSFSDQTFKNLFQTSKKKKKSRKVREAFYHRNLFAEMTRPIVVVDAKLLEGSTTLSIVFNFNTPSSQTTDATNQHLDQEWRSYKT